MPSASHVIKATNDSNISPLTIVICFLYARHPTLDWGHMPFWYRVDLPLYECRRNGKADQLQKAFEVMFLTNQKPQDAALFEWHDEIVQNNVFFFSPAGASLIRSLLKGVGAVECGPPILSDRLVLLVGHAGARETLLGKYFRTATF